MGLGFYKKRLHRLEIPTEVLLEAVTHGRDFGSECSLVRRQAGRRVQGTGRGPQSSRTHNEGSQALCVR